MEIFFFSEPIDATNYRELSAQPVIVHNLLQRGTRKKRKSPNVYSNRFARRRLHWNAKNEAIVPKEMLSFRKIKASEDNLLLRMRRKHHTRGDKEIMDEACNKYMDERGRIYANKALLVEMVWITGDTDILRSLQEVISLSLSLFSLLSLSPLSLSPLSPSLSLSPSLIVLKIG